MKKYNYIIAVAALAVGIQIGFSDETGKPHTHHDHGHGGHHATILVPEDPAELWAHINAYAKVVSDSAASGDIDKLHKEQVNLEALVGELGHLLNVVPEDKRERTKSMIKNAKRALGQLHEATDAKKTNDIKKSAKSLTGVMALIKAAFPKDLTGGMAEVVDDIGPHEGMLAKFKDSSGKAIGFIELKLHDDKGDLELWIARDRGITKPFDIGATEKITVEFATAKEKSATLAVRNTGKNEDEDGHANMRGGNTNYFIFPGDTGVSAAWLQGTKFKSDVTISFSGSGTSYKTDSFMLIPHGHHGHDHEH